MSKLLSGTTASKEHELWSSLTEDQKKRIREITQGTSEHNLEAEQALLGACLIQNSNIGRCAGLSHEHFYIPLHQRIWFLLQKSYEEGVLADPITMKSSFREEDIIHGGHNYLAGCMAKSVTVIEPRNYANLIKDLATKRRIIAIMMKHLLTKSDDDKLAAEWNNAILSDLMNIPDGSSNKIMTWKQATLEITKDMKSGGARPQSTGIYCLDHALHGGFYDQMTFGFIAPSGKGKTSIALTIFGNMVNSAIGTGDKMLYICAEMGAVNCHRRVQAKEMKMSSTDFYDRRDDMEHMLAIEDYSDGDCDKPGLYADASQITFSELRRVFTTTRKRNNVRGFFLDYLSLVQPDPGCRLSRVEFLETVANWIASFCVKNSCWSMIVEQANDDGSTRWGKALAQASDFLFLMQGDRYLVNDVELSCAWLRNQKERHWPVPNIGTPKKPALILDPRGPHFRDVTDYDDVRIKGTFKVMDDDA